MARGKSVIDVLIVGDVKNLSNAFSKADSSMGGLLKSAGKVFLASAAVSEGFQFLQDATQESDRLGDAIARLNGQVGGIDSQKLQDTATAFTNLGQSKQDVLELEANFADLTTSVGLTQDQITTFAPEAVKTAAALSLLKDADPSTIMDQISKAVGGSARAAKELGVTLLDGVTPAEQFRNIMDQLAPTVSQVTDNSLDLEGQQRKLGAQWETLQANVGQLVEGPLTDLLGFINDEIEAIPGAIQGWQMLGGAVEQFGRDALGPIARVNDALGSLGNLIGDVAFNLTHIGQNVPNERQILQQLQANELRNGRPG